MQKNKKKFKYWNQQSSNGLLKSLLSICLVLMMISQLFLTMNRLQIKWYKQKVMNVTADSSSTLIIATDVEKNKAGAMNYKGETVIPFENNIFDPWTGDLISQGLYHEGDLYWTNQQGKVGIVNAENKEIIPKEYGFLQRGLENQFIAGTGILSEVVSGGGQYIQKKYGVIAEGNQLIIPFEYDELSISENGVFYYGVIYEDTRTIRRSLKTDGSKKEEDIVKLVIEEASDTSSAITESEDDSADGTEPQTEETKNQESETQKENKQTETEEESESESESEPETKLESNQGDSDIQQYDGEEEATVIQDKYNDMKERTIHYHNGTTTLEVLNQNIILAEFPGIRTPDVNEPVFSDDEKLIIDNWEEAFHIYSAKDGQLLCSVKTQTDYQYSGTLLVYRQENTYEVKNLNNQILFSIEAGEQDQFMNSAMEIPRFVFQEDYFVYQGDNGRTLVTDQGVVIAQDLDVIYYNNENAVDEKDSPRVFICERDDKFGAFSFTGEKILDFLYANVEFFNGHVKALRITDDKGKVGITDYSGNLIIPIEYDNVGFGTNIQGADDRLIETYMLLYGEEEDNRYFGQKGNEIYYLDDNGGIVDRVQYVAKQEQSGGGLSDLLAFKKQMENRIVYRTTGSQKVMCNAFGIGLTYRRSQVEARLNSKGITFLCIDTVGGQIGIYDHSYGAFTFMGYQQSVYNLWLVVSRLFLILGLFFLLSGISWRKIQWNIGAGIYKWRQKHEKKR